MSCRGQSQRQQARKSMIYSVRSEQYCVFLSFASQRAWYRTYDPVQDSSADVVSADC